MNFVSNNGRQGIYYGQAGCYPKGHQKRLDVYLQKFYMFLQTQNQSPFSMICIFHFLSTYQSLSSETAWLLIVKIPGLFGFYLFIFFEGTNK